MVILGSYLIIFTNFVPISLASSKKFILNIAFNKLVFPAEMVAITGTKFVISTFSVIFIIIFKKD